MKLITLNTWGGQVTQPLYDFLEENKDDIDIFCFQEVFNGKIELAAFPNGVKELYAQMENRLTNHSGFFARAQSIGLATFFKKDMKLFEEGNIFVFRWLDAMQEDAKTLGKNIQYVIVEYQGKNVLIINFHGLWNGGGKTDTSDRIDQSKKVKEFIKRFNLPTILCGDFNLLPDTKSIAILEDGMINLIKTHNITSTRTSFYEKEVRFADYILVSQEIKVKDFRVLSDEVSDHSPLYLEFEL